MQAETYLVSDSAQIDDAIQALRRAVYALSLILLKKGIRHDTKAVGCSDSVLLSLGVGGTIAAVAIIDPFEVYHKATAFIPRLQTARRSIPTRHR